MSTRERELTYTVSMAYYNSILPNIMTRTSKTVYYVEWANVIHGSFDKNVERLFNDGSSTKYTKETNRRDQYAFGQLVFKDSIETDISDVVRNKAVICERHYGKLDIGLLETTLKYPLPNMDIETIKPSKIEKMFKEISTNSQPSIMPTIAVELSIDSTEQDIDKTKEWLVTAFGFDYATLYNKIKHVCSTEITAMENALVPKPKTLDYENLTNLLKEERYPLLISHKPNGFAAIMVATPTNGYVILSDGGVLTNDIPKDTSPIPHLISKSFINRTHLVMHDPEIYLVHGELVEDMFIVFATLTHPFKSTPWQAIFDTDTIEHLLDRYKHKPKIIFKQHVEVNNMDDLKKPSYSTDGLVLTAPLPNNSYKSIKVFKIKDVKDNTVDLLYKSGQMFCMHANNLQLAIGYEVPAMNVGKPLPIDNMADVPLHNDVIYECQIDSAGVLFPRFSRLDKKYPNSLRALISSLVHNSVDEWLKILGTSTTDSMYKCTNKHPHRPLMSGKIFHVIRSMITNLRDISGKSVDIIDIGGGKVGYSKIIGQTPGVSSYTNIDASRSSLFEGLARLIGINAKAIDNKVLPVDKIAICHGCVDSPSTLKQLTSPIQYTGNLILSIFALNHGFVTKEAGINTVKLIGSVCVSLGHVGVITYEYDRIIDDMVNGVLDLDYIKFTIHKNPRLITVHLPFVEDTIEEAMLPHQEFVQLMANEGFTLINQRPFQSSCFDKKTNKIVNVTALNYICIYTFTKL